MKAAQISTYGDTSVITVNDIEQPKIGAGQVLVAVHAASLNPFDTIVRAGYMKDMIPLTFPVTLGGDIAGEVTEVGDGVTNVAVGDKVYGQANVVAGNSGAFAEYAATSAAQVTQLPDTLGYEQAAALPLVGSSALQALTQHINLQPGQKIFIHGGAGAIGAIAIQVAKHIGAYVAASATGENIEYIKSLGADEVIDYKAQEFAEVLEGYDAVFDTVGGQDFGKSFAILKRGGIAVTMAAQPDEALAAEHGVTAIAQMTHVTSAVLDQLTELVESGIVQPHIGKVYPLVHIKEAFIAREAGTIRGKIVIKIQ